MENLFAVMTERQITTSFNSYLPLTCLRNLRYAAVTLLLVIGVGNVLGAASITFSSLSLENGVAYNDAFNIDENITIQFPEDGNNGKYYTTGAAIRSYGGNTFIVAADAGHNITAITLTFGSGDGSNTITTNVGSYSNGSWSGSASSVTFSVGGNSGHRRIAGVSVTYSASCAKSVTIEKGTATNCKFSLSKSEAQASCDGVATTVTVTPNTGYTNPVVTQSGASAAPTITGSGTTWTVTYEANTTGTSTINVSCSANNYTITLDNEGADSGKEGTASISVTFDASTNLTSAIIKPTKTGWTFGGYYTAKNGGGTQIIDADGNVNVSVASYTGASKQWIKASDVTLYAKWTCTVTWSVNGSTSVYSAQTVTYNSSGCKVGSVPTISDLSDYCGDKFVGWTTEANVSQNNDTGLGLFTNVAGSPNITGDITFYAVFADYAE